MALKILLKGSSPSKEVVEKVLNKQELKEVEFLSSDQTAGQDYLLLENATNLNYDFKYLIGQARARGQGETELLEYRENGGQELELLGPDFVRNEAKVLSSDYFDGHQGTGIRYFLASGEGRFGIASTAHKNELIEVEHRPCLFLDRDGIINEEGDYPHKISQIIFKEELFPIISWARKKHYRVIVLTNQAGIARGFFGPREVEQLHTEMDQELRKRGFAVDAWYYCPYYWPKGEGAYKKHSLLRKPAPGMLLKALADFQINLDKSLMIGDKISDALQMPGLKSYILEGNYDLSDCPADTFSDLDAIYRQILEDFK